MLEARSPDLVVVDKKEKSCEITDSSVSEESRIEKKENDKIEKHHNLGMELQKI